MGIDSLNLIRRVGQMARAFWPLSNSDSFVAPKISKRSLQTSFQKNGSWPCEPVLKSLICGMRESGIQAFGDSGYNALLTFRMFRPTQQPLVELRLNCFQPSGTIRSAATFLFPEGNVTSLMQVGISYEDGRSNFVTQTNRYLLQTDKKVKFDGCFVERQMRVQVAQADAEILTQAGTRFEKKDGPMILEEVTRELSPPAWFQGVWDLVTKGVSLPSSLSLPWKGDLENSYATSGKEAYQRLMTPEFKEVFGDYTIGIESAMGRYVIGKAMDPSDMEQILGPRYYTAYHAAKLRGSSVDMMRYPDLWCFSGEM